MSHFYGTEYEIWAGWQYRSFWTGLYLKYATFEDNFFYVFRGKNKFKLFKYYSVCTKKFHNIGVRKPFFLLENVSVNKTQNTSKTQKSSKSNNQKNTHIQLWVALLEIPHRATYV